MSSPEKGVFPHLGRSRDRKRLSWKADEKLRSTTQSTGDFAGKHIRRLKIYLKAQMEKNISGKSNDRSKGVEVMTEQDIFRSSECLWCDWDVGTWQGVGTRVQNRHMNRHKCHAKGLGLHLRGIDIPQVVQYSLINHTMPLWLALMASFRCFSRIRKNQTLEKWKLGTVATGKAY